MAERPTPHSIAVCTLIALHSDPSSPIHSVTHDNPNDYNDPISHHHSSNIIEYLVLSNPEGWTMTNSKSRFIRDVNHESSLTSSSLGGTMEKKIMPLSELVKLINGGNYYDLNNRNDKSDLRGGMRMGNVLVQDLQQSAASMDSFMDLFSALRSTVANGIIDGESAFGVYVRKRCLGFDELSFEAVSRLWSCFCRYVHPKQEQEEDEEEWPLSPHQLEREIIQQTLSSSSQDNNNNNNRHPLKDETSYNYFANEQLEQLLADNPELPSLHYLKFQNCMHQKERLGALDSLHRYFDYAMIRERKDRWNSHTATGSASSASSGSIVQYAAILLAYLHTSFGDNHLAQKATEEAVRVAQQSGDNTCVAFALGWLQQFYNNNSNNNNITRMTNSASSNARSATSTTLNERVISTAATIANAPILERAAIQGIQLNIPSLVTNASLALARQSAIHHRNPHTTTHHHDTTRRPNNTAVIAWQCLSAATTEGRTVVGTHNATTADDYDNHSITHPTNDNHNALQDCPTQIYAHTTTIQEITSALAQQSIITSGLWETFGHSNMSSFWSHLALSTYYNKIHQNNKRTKNNHQHLYLHKPQQEQTDVSLLWTKIAMATLYGSAQHRMVNYHHHQKRNQDNVNLRTELKSLIASSNSQKKDKFNTTNTNNATSNLLLDREYCCVYQEAMTKLENLRKNHSHNYERKESDTNYELDAMSQQIYNHTHTFLNLEWAIRRLDFVNAQHLHIVLHSYNPQPILSSSQQQSVTAAFQATAFTSLLLAEQDDYEHAIQVMEHICSTCQNLRLHHSFAQYSLRLALLHIDCYNHSHNSNPTLALPPLLHCLSLCEDHDMHSWHACALSVLGEVHFQLGNLKLAKSLIQSCIPSLMQNAHLWFQGKAWLVLAKCYLYEAKNYSSRTTAKNNTTNETSPLIYDDNDLSIIEKRGTGIRNCLSNLRTAKEIFQKIYDIKLLKEIAYLDARCYHTLLCLFGNTKSRKELLTKRNIAAKDFSILQQKSSEIKI